MGKLSEKLTSARKSKNDEFYTQMPDIELECNHYKKDFYNKVIYCNCDNPYESNFYKYFVSHFNEFNIKKVIATCYIENSNGICAIYDGTETIYNLNGDGDFRSNECIKFIPNISLGTVYRNLNNLASSGIILKIETPDGKAHFDGDVISCEVGVAKPSPAIYDLILERFGIKAEESIFIDDNADNVAGAEAVGMKALRFESAIQAEQELKECYGIEL